MLRNLEIIHRPTAVSQAVRLLRNGGESSAVLAGGTALAVSGRNRLRELVDLSRCGLDGIRVSGNRLRLGAMVRFADLAEWPGAAEHRLEALRECAAQAGSALTRNLITTGGNVCQRFPWCHLPVVLVALDAVVVFAGAGKKSAPAAEFFAAPPARTLGVSGIVQEMVVPLVRDRRAAFQRFARTRTDRALVTAAAAFRVCRGRMRDVRAVAGGLAPAPQRAAAVESALEGEKPGPALFETLEGADLGALTVASDMRAGREYKAQLAATLFVRAFMGAHGAFRRGGTD